MFKQINQKKDHLDAKRPLPTYTLSSLREKLLLEWTYNSNAIEGNTLTINETKVVLEGITVGGKTMREHLEVINHRDAITYVEEIVKKTNLYRNGRLKIYIVWYLKKSMMIMQALIAISKCLSQVPNLRQHPHFLLRNKWNSS